MHDGVTGDSRAASKEHAERIKQMRSADASRALDELVREGPAGLNVLLDLFSDPAIHDPLDPLPGRVLLAILRFGADGARAISERLASVGFLRFRSDTLETLAALANGQLPRAALLHSAPHETTGFPIDQEMQGVARREIARHAASAKDDPDMRFALIHALHLADVLGASEYLLGSLFDVGAEVRSRLTERLVQQFEQLVAEDRPEAEYQSFLGANPVLLDALAMRVIAQQQLGTALRTDFVVQRYDSEYVLVEIETPKRQIFRADGGFAAEFTHAFGQIQDFQEFVADQPAFAASALPGIRLPAGLLVIGRRRDLSERQRHKLDWWNINHRNHAEVRCFDDLVERGRRLLANLRRV